MEWLAENWVLVALIGGMAVFHLFGHGHGGHKGGKTDKHQDSREKPSDASASTRSPPDDA